MGLRKSEQGLEAKMIIGTQKRPVAVARFDRVDDHQACVEIVHNQLRKQGAQDTSDVVVIVEDDFQHFGSSALKGNKLLSIKLSQSLPGITAPAPASTVHCG
jgi:hypothetical protein